MVFKLILIYSIALMPVSYAARAVVKVLEAPLFRVRDLNSRVVQYVRKGKVIYIHDKHLGKDAYVPDYENTLKIYDIDQNQASYEDQVVENILAEDESDIINDFNQLSDQEFFEEGITEDNVTYESWEQRDIDALDNELGDIDLDDPESLIYEDEANELPDSLIQSNIAEIDKQNFSSLDATILSDNDDLGFYKTVDQNGLTAYIPKEFVKVIYENPKEDADPIYYINKNGSKHDPTDYRLKEPLPEHYPFVTTGSVRAYATFGYATQSKDSYSYTSEIKSSEFGQRYNISLVVLDNADFDETKRFYFGGIVDLNFDDNEFLLNNGEAPATEKKAKMGFGPYFLYDALAYKKLKIAFVGGILLYPFNRVVVSQNGVFDSAESRTYKGISWGPTFGTLLQFDRLFNALNLVTGVTINTEFGHTLETNEKGTIPDIWVKTNTSDTYSRNFQAQLNLIFGFQYKY